MRILYIYRHKDSGPSIRRVFEPIAVELSKTENVDSLYLPYKGASIGSMMKNCRFVVNYLAKSNYDVIHITGDVYYLIFALRKYNVVATVHDVGYIVNYKLNLRIWILKQLLLKPLKLCKAITFISVQTKEQCKRLIQIPESKLIVIPNAVGSGFDFHGKVCDANRPNILHLGTKPNKNLYRVIEALKGINCHLTIIGPLSSDEMNHLQEANISYTNHSYVRDEQILQAYMDCDVVSFPSLFEGFGMPIIEGQAIGRPVVTSNVQPMLSIAGDGAIIVNPYDVEDIARGFKDATVYFDDVVNRGLNNVEKYKLIHIASQYKNLYLKLLKQ